MFYADNLLTRRGPLAKVWLAAHWEKKLTKQQLLQTDIGDSVGAILEQEMLPMALRLSGQLLLGVARIYSRKAKYLLDDCNDALLKIKMAFRPGVVDMTEEQLTVPRNAITLNEQDMDFDMMMGDMNWNLDLNMPEPSGQHVARMADITLNGGENIAFDFDDPYANPFVFEDGIDSQEIDLNIGDEPMDEQGEEQNAQGNEEDSMSVEIGRDGGDVSRSLERSFGEVPGLAGQLDDFGASGNFGADDDMGGFNNFEFDIPEGGLNIDWDAPVDVPDLVGGQQVAPAVEKAASPASSRLTSPPPTPPPAGNVDLPMLTPRAAARVNKMAEKQANQGSKKKVVAKKQVIDAVTELDDGTGSFGRSFPSQTDKDLSGILTEHQMLPGSRSVMQLLQIRADPLAHFLPTRTTDSDTFFIAGPPGLAPELAELFTFSANRRRVAEEDIDNRAAKRPRLSASEVDDVEIGRRDQTPSRSLVMGDDLFAPGHDDQQFMFDDSGMQDPAMMDVDMDQAAWGMGDHEVALRDHTPQAARASKGRSMSRFSTPGLNDMAQQVQDGATYEDLICPIAVFDTRHVDGTHGTQETQGADEDVDLDLLSQEPKHHGFSKNTLKAVAILKRELEPEQDQAGEELDKSLSFKEVSQKASRRAASSFFFELLVLGTRDCVKLGQSEAFGNIEVRAKEKLWDSGVRGAAAADEADGEGAATPVRASLTPSLVV